MNCLSPASTILWLFPSIFCYISFESGLSFSSFGENRETTHQTHTTSRTLLPRTFETSSQTHGPAGHAAARRNMPKLPHAKRVRPVSSDSRKWGFETVCKTAPKFHFFNHPGTIQKPPSNDQLSRKPLFKFFRVLRESNARTEKGVLCQNLYVPPVGRTVCAHWCTIPSCNYRYSQIKQTDFQVDKVTATIENTGHSTPCKCFWIITHTCLKSSSIFFFSHTAC